jgi:hypothetical protein
MTATTAKAMGQRASPTTRDSFVFGAASGVMWASISDEAAKQAHQGVAEPSSVSSVSDVRLVGAGHRSDRVEAAVQAWRNEHPAC